MLVLSRKVGETIKIGDNVTVMVVKIEAGKVRIGIEAHPDVNVDRSEIREAKQSKPAPDAK